MELFMRDKNMKSSVLLATDRCLTRMPVDKGASTLIVDEHKEPFYATEVASPLFGAAVSTADELQGVLLYATEVASPVVFLGHRLQSLKDIPVTLYTRLKSRPLMGVENKRNLCLFYATEVASPE
jgi:hypothetical protein